MILALAGASNAASDEMRDSLAESATIMVVEEPTVIIAETQDNAEDNAIPESSIAKKMTQAEKAENARVNDSWGGAITIIAMCIVISALVVLSLLFLGFGKISESLMKKNKRNAAKPGTLPSDSDGHEPDSGEAIAAIAAALAEHFGEGHDIEDTILTIRRMKRAYSPWNSKIYNLRVMPELHKNPRI